MNLRFVIIVSILFVFWTGRRHLL